MKQTPQNKLSKSIWLVSYLFLIATVASAQGGAISEKAKLNTKFSDIASNMKAAYEDGEFSEVIKVYKERCCREWFERNKDGVCKEKRGFKKVKKDIRATIYKWVVLSYVALDKPGMVEIYLRKLFHVSKPELKETFRYIAGEIKDSFENGKLNKVIDLYNKYCGKHKKGGTVKEKKEFKKISRGIRANIYQWITLSYDALNRPDMADIYLKKLLDIRYDLGIGDFWPSIRDRAEEKYIVAPRLLVGIKAGSNFTIANPFNRYTILNNTAPIINGSYDKDYIFSLGNSFGLHSGIILEYSLKKNFSFCIQPALIDIRFRYKNTFVWDENNNITVEYTHRHKFYYIELPLFLKYSFIKSKLKPYLQIGGFFRYLQFAHKSIDIDKRREPRMTQDFNLKGLITRLNCGFCVGVGFGYDIGRLRLEMEVDYKLGLNNIVNKSQRHAHVELMFGYYDVFDDLTLNNWDLAFKILIPISFKAFRR